MRVGASSGERKIFIRAREEYIILQFFQQLWDEFALTERTVLSDASDEITGIDVSKADKAENLE